MRDIFVPIDKAGRLVLPKEVREELAINPGDLLKVSIHGDEVMLQPRKTKVGLVRKGQALIFSTGADDLLSREAVEAILAGEREARGSLANAGLPRRKRHQ